MRARPRPLLVAEISRSGRRPAPAGDDANARAHHLDRGDERPGDESGPQDRMPELRADH